MGLMLPLPLQPQHLLQLSHRATLAHRWLRRASVVAERAAAALRRRRRAGPALGGGGRATAAAVQHQPELSTSCIRQLRIRQLPAIA